MKFLCYSQLVITHQTFENIQVMERFNAYMEQSFQFILHAFWSLPAVILCQQKIDLKVFSLFWSLPIVILCQQKIDLKVFSLFWSLPAVILCQQKNRP